mmetsp:Transcript_9282/g.56514  ORF Transcript_9282/g.56514 Transcript_9282/m.56514 type:complete len:257 (-) Transcript_9282:694-1464(-)
MCTVSQRSKNCFKSHRSEANGTTRPVRMTLRKHWHFRYYGSIVDMFLPHPHLPHWQHAIYKCSLDPSSRHPGTSAPVCESRRSLHNKIPSQSPSSYGAPPAGAYLQRKLKGSKQRVDQYDRVKLSAILPAIASTTRNIPDRWQDHRNLDEGQWKHMNPHAAPMKRNATLFPVIALDARRSIEQRKGASHNPRGASTNHSSWRRSPAIGKGTSTIEQGGRASLRAVARHLLNLQAQSRVASGGVFAMKWSILQTASK